MGGDGEKGRGGAFGNQAGIVNEYGLCAALSGGVGAGKDVGQEVEGFYVAPFPSDIGVCGDGYASGLFVAGIG